MNEVEPQRQRPKRSTPRRAARAAGLSVLMVGAIVGIGACMNVGERMAYHPSRATFETPAGFEDITFESADGTALHAWFMHATNPGGKRAPVVVHAHGNAGHIGHHTGFSSFLRDHGIHVLIFDYRGYGRSEDKRPTRAALIEDTWAALSAARRHPSVNPDRVGLFGVSLGGAFALPVAAEDQGVRAVATLSAFSTWRGVANDWVPVLGPALIHAGHDPEDAAAMLGDRPYLIVHGDADRVIHVRHAERLREAAQSAGVPTTTLVIEDADHNSIIDSHREASETIAAFFVEHLREAP